MLSYFFAGFGVEEVEEGEGPGVEEVRDGH